MPSTNSVVIPPDVTMPIVVLHDTKPRLRVMDRRTAVQRIMAGSLMQVGERTFKARFGAVTELRRLPLFKQRKIKILPPMRGMSEKMSPKRPDGEGDFRKSPYFRLLDSLTEASGIHAQRSREIVDCWDGGRWPSQ